MTPNEAARWLRHLAGDTSYKMDTESHDPQYVMEDLLHRLIALADELEGRPVDPEEPWTPAYEVTHWDDLAAGHWV